MSENKANRATESDKSAVQGRESQKKRFLIFGLCSFVALLICTGSVLGVAISLITEGVYEFDEYIPSKTDKPKTDAETIAFLGNLVDGAKDDERVYVDFSTEVSVEDDSIAFDGNENEKNVLMYMKGSIISAVDALYPKDYEGKFNDGYKDYPVIKLDSDELISAECSEGTTDSDGEAIETESYFFTLSVAGGKYLAEKGSGIFTTFDLDDEEKIVASLLKEIEPMFTVIEKKIIPKDFKIEAKSDRFTDQISSVTLSRFYTITLKIEFKGEFASLGVKSLSFDYGVRENYNYTWAGVFFNEDSISLGEGDETALSLSSEMNDNDSYQIRFESSDESVATIDEMGYVKGIGSSKKPITVTVYLSYLGHDYSDTCKVLVGVPAEKIEISEDERSASVGESFSLSAEISPKNATNKDVIWISEDESVAKVGDDGVVIAVGAGNTLIIAVSDDGHFRDSCSVTVS